MVWFSNLTEATIQQLSCQVQNSVYTGVIKQYPLTAAASAKRLWLVEGSLGKCGLVQ